MTPQIVVGGLIVKRGGRVVLRATTPRQMALARFLVRGA